MLISFTRAKIKIGKMWALFLIKRCTIIINFLCPQPFFRSMQNRFSTLLSLKLNNSTKHVRIRLNFSPRFNADYKCHLVVCDSAIHCARRHCFHRGAQFCGDLSNFGKSFHCNLRLKFRFGRVKKLRNLILLRLF